MGGDPVSSYQMTLLGRQRTRAPPSSCAGAGRRIVGACRRVPMTVDVPCRSICSRLKANFITPFDSRIAGQVRRDVPSGACPGQRFQRHGISAVHHSIGAFATQGAERQYNSLDVVNLDIHDGKYSDHRQADNQYLRHTMKLHPIRLCPRVDQFERATGWSLEFYGMHRGSNTGRRPQVERFVNKVSRGHDRLSLRYLPPIGQQRICIDP